MNFDFTRILLFFYENHFYGKNHTKQSKKKISIKAIGRILSDELKNKIIEALNLYFEKEGTNITEKDLKIKLDLPHFFEFYKVINADFWIFYKNSIEIIHFFFMLGIKLI